MGLFVDGIEKLEIRLLESPLGQRLLGWYRRLPDRDQWLFRVGSVAALALLAIGLLVAPPVRFAQAQLQAYQRAAADHAWLLEREAPARRAAASLARAADATALQELVLDSARAADLTLKRQQPTGDGAQRVWLEGVSFVALTRWIAQLDQRHQLRVAALAVTPRATGGLVDARLDIGA